MSKKHTFKATIMTWAEAARSWKQRTRSFSKTPSPAILRDRTHHADEFSLNGRVVKFTF